MQSVDKKMIRRLRRLTQINEEQEKQPLNRRSRRIPNEKINLYFDGRSRHLLLKAQFCLQKWPFKGVNRSSLDLLCNNNYVLSWSDPMSRS